MATRQRSDLKRQIKEEMSAQARSIDKYYMIAADMEDTAHPDAMDNAIRSIQMQEAELDGMGKLAFALGFRCNCETQVDTGRPAHCTCTKRKTQKENVGRGPYVLDGAGCRDGQGLFVPTSQCRGPVGRDASGRFVSIKRSA